VPGGDPAYFLLGVLNSRVVDFVFRRIAKPKERRPSGAYFEANKQYIAPLPIPDASADQRTFVARQARELQQLHTSRRRAIEALDDRLASSQLVEAPERLELHLARIDGKLSYGATMGAVAGDGELTFFVAGRPIASVHAGRRDASLVLAQWQQRARDRFVSNEIDAARIIEWLLDLKTTDNAELIDQIATLTHSLDEIESKIRRTERDLDDYIYGLYGLSTPERAMIEADTRTRWDARIPMLAK
jgi:hypothetical protein